MGVEWEKTFRHSFYSSTLNFTIKQTIQTLPLSILLILSFPVWRFLNRGQLAITNYFIVILDLFIIGLICYITYRVIILFTLIILPILFSYLFLYLVVTGSFFDEFSSKIIGDIVLLFLIILFCTVTGFFPIYTIRPPKPIIFRTNGKKLESNFKNSGAWESFDLDGSRELIITRRTRNFPAERKSHKIYRIIHKKYEFWTIRLVTRNHNEIIINTERWFNTNKKWYLTTDLDTFNWISKLIMWFMKELDFQVNDQSGLPNLHYKHDLSYQIVDQIKSYDRLGFSMMTDNRGKVPHVLTPSDIVEQVSEDNKYSYALETTKTGYLYKMYPSYPYSIFPIIMKIFELCFLILWVITAVEYSITPFDLTEKLYYQQISSLMVLMLYLIYQHKRYVSLEIDQNQIKISQTLFNLSYRRHYIQLRNLVGVIQCEKSIEFVGIENRLKILGEISKDESRKLIVSIMHILQFVCNFSKLIAYDLQYYYCRDCNYKIESNSVTCPNCRITAPKCIICYLQSYDSKEIAFYDCCNSIAHLEHARQWNEVRNYCPYCRTGNPIIKLVENSK